MLSRVRLPNASATAPDYEAFVWAYEGQRSRSRETPAEIVDKLMGP